MALSKGESEILAAERWSSELGELYEGDALEVLPQLDDGAFDLIFLDPPFNLGKRYGDRVDDSRPDDEYLQWCTRWLAQVTRLLAPGGSVFLYNLPRWNIALAPLLGDRLTFRNWIAIEMRSTPPLANRLYPSHYSLLYFTNGEPKVFAPPRVPLTTCRDCGLELHDYGGYKGKMHPQGRSLSDVWTDISPSRHRTKVRQANELPVKLLDRVLDMASTEGSRILDPFAGAGTCLIVAELKGRRWTGIEIETVDPIVARFADTEADAHALDLADSSKNRLFTPTALKRRQLKGRGLAHFAQLREPA